MRSHDQLPIWSSATIVVVGLLAMGTGGTHTQGTYLCGEYLDQRDSDAGVYPIANCISQIRQNIYDGGSFTFHAYNPMTRDIREVDVMCKSSPSSDYIRDCKIKKRQRYPEMRQACGAKRDAVLLQGLAGGGTVDFSVTSSLLLACAGEEGHPDSKTMGAIGRCVRLFNAPLARGNTDEFLACVRAARADYCGCGDSRTHGGVWIQLANDPDDLGPPEIELSCLEAGWIPGGAQCFQRKRIQEVFSLVAREYKIIKEELEKNPPQDQTRAKHLRAANQCLTDCSTRLDAVADGGVFGSGLPQEQCDLNHPKALLYNLSRIIPVDADQPERGCP